MHNVMYNSNAEHVKCRLLKQGKTFFCGLGFFTVRELHSYEAS